MERKVRWMAAGCLALLAVGLTCMPVQAAEPQPVTIYADLTWSALGNGMVFWAPPVYGTFSATGAVADSGSATGWYSYYFGGAPPASLTLSGANGALYIVVSGGSWTITGGTGSYANATGSGSAAVTTTVYSFWGYVYGYRWQYSLQGTASLG